MLSENIKIICKKSQITQETMQETEARAKSICRGIGTKWFFLAKMN